MFDEDFMHASPHSLLMLGTDSVKMLMQLLQPHLKLGLLLARERRYGEKSFWNPYITMLGPPPCAWALPSAAVDAVIADLGMNSKPSHRCTFVASCGEMHDFVRFACRCPAQWSTASCKFRC